MRICGELLSDRVFLIQWMCSLQTSMLANNLWWSSLYAVAQILLSIISSTISHQVGTEWRSPFNRCIVNECVRVNNEVFVQQKNISCSQMDMPDCPEGTELRCDQVIDCCPSCRCGKVLCMTNGIASLTCWCLVSQQQFPKCMFCKYTTALKLSCII